MPRFRFASCLLLLAVTGVVFGPGACVVSNKDPDNLVTPQEALYCLSSDDKCVVAQFSCGSSGGYRVAINSRFRDSVSPASVINPNTGLSGDPTCVNEVAAVCMSTTCHLVPIPLGSCQTGDESCAQGR
jgi:hypothetical protein